jgi:hypothetical protein
VGHRRKLVGRRCMRVLTTTAALLLGVGIAASGAYASAPAVRTAAEQHPSGGLVAAHQARHIKANDAESTAPVTVGPRQVRTTGTEPDGCKDVSGFEGVTASETLTCVTVESGGTLDIENTGGCGTGYPTITLTLTNGGTIDSGGTVELNTSNNCNEGGDSELDVTGGTLLNEGTISSDWASSDGGNRYIEGDVDNTSAVDIDNATYFEDGKITNAGTFTVGSGSYCPGQCVAYVQDSESFDNAADGSIVDESESGYSSGSFTEDGGTFTEAGATSGPDVVVDGATLDYTGPGASDIIIEGTSTLEGTSSAGQVLEPQGGDSLSLSAPSGFTNGGTINFDSGSEEANFAIGSGKTLTNSGLLEAGNAAGSSEFTTISGNVTNTGSVLAGASLTFSGPGTFVNKGTFTSPANESITLNGGESFDNATKGSIVDQTETNSSPGSFTEDGGTFTEAGATTGPDVVVDGATLDYTGPGASDIIIEGTSTLEGASSAGQVLEPQGGDSLSLSAPSGFTNGGTINFDSGSEEANFAIGSGKTLTNSGLLEAGNAAGSSEFTTIDGSGTLVNHGIIAVYGSAYLTLNTLSNLSAGTLTGGSYEAIGGSQLQMPGSVKTLAAKITESDTAGFGSALNSLSAISSAGSLHLIDGANLDLSGSLSNAGTVALGSSDTLHVGSAYTQDSTGSLLTTIAGTSAGSTYGQLVVGGEATLGGILDLTEGYAPSLGDSQNVVTFSTSIGQFGRIKGKKAGGGLYFVLQYTPGSAELVVAATKVDVSPHSGKPGKVVTFSGTGFSPGETVDVSFKDEAGKVFDLTSATANGSGSFSVEETVPEGISSGVSAFSATGQTSEVSLKAKFTVT